MSNYPKRHHTTPCLVLRNFADVNERFFVFDKRIPDERVVKDSIYNRFVVKHQNSRKRNDGTRDFSLETHFTFIETTAYPVLMKIIENVRARQTPLLLESEKRAWDQFLLAQWRRTPLRRNSISDAEFRTQLDEVLENFEANHGRRVTDQERLHFTSPAKVSELREYAIFEGLKKEMPLAGKMLSEKGLAFATVANPKKSFIVGDNTVMKMVPEHTNDLHDPEVEMWFPIAHNVLVTPWGKCGQQEVFVLNSDKVRQVNEVIYRESLLVASRSKALLTSLANSELKRAA